jgi:hypothetical protein
MFDKAEFISIINIYIIISNIYYNIFEIALIEKNIVQRKIFT